MNNLDKDTAIAVLPKYKFEKIKKHIRQYTPTGIYVYLNNIYKDNSVLDIKTLNEYCRMYSSADNYNKLLNKFKEDVNIELNSENSIQLPFFKKKSELKTNLQGDDDSSFSGFIIKKKPVITTKSDNSDQVVISDIATNIEIDHSVQGIELPGL
jgi:hypothetical protein